MSIKIELPYPDSILNPNRKAHWSKKHRAQRKQKEMAFWVAKERGAPPRKKKYDINVIFHPPDNRRRDEDNAIASLKGAFDGIALAWGVDDSLFHYTQEWKNMVKKGKVIIMLK